MICLQIANEWNLKGSINIQLRLIDNKPIIFEINPRFSSTVYMRHKLGFKDLIWSLADFYNEKIYFENLKEGTIIVRTQDVSIIP